MSRTSRVGAAHFTDPALLSPPKGGLRNGRREFIRPTIDTPRAGQVIGTGRAPFICRNLPLPAMGVLPPKGCASLTQPSPVRRRADFAMVAANLFARRLTTFSRAPGRLSVLAARRLSAGTCPYRRCTHRRTHAGVRPPLCLLYNYPHYWLAPAWTACYTFISLFLQLRAAWPPIPIPSDMRNPA